MQGLKRFRFAEGVKSPSTVHENVRKATGKMGTKTNVQKQPPENNSVERVALQFWKLNTPTFSPNMNTIYLLSGGTNCTTPYRPLLNQHHSSLSSNLCSVQSFSKAFLLRPVAVSDLSVRNIASPTLSVRYFVTSPVGVVCGHRKSPCTLRAFASPE